MRGWPVLPLLLLAAGCGTQDTPPPRPVAAQVPPPPARQAGLDRVMGQEAGSVIALLGQPALDLREGPARKLQFRGPACVLDAYLYPPSGGSGAARVSWIDARTPVGADMDRASCIGALARH